MRVRSLLDGALSVGNQIILINNTKLLIKANISENSVINAVKTFLNFWA